MTETAHADRTSEQETMSSTNAEVAEVMDRVRGWPSTTRIALAKRILDSLDASATDVPPPVSGATRPLRGVPVAEVIGLLRTDAPAPTDEDCRRIIEEERWRKYGIPGS